MYATNKCADRGTKPNLTAPFLQVGCIIIINISGNRDTHNNLLLEDCEYMQSSVSAKS